MYDKMTLFLDDDEGDEIKEIVGDAYDGSLYGPHVKYLNPPCTFLDLNVSTKVVSVYTSESMN